jgi:hypothetical protein
MGGCWVGLVLLALCPPPPPPPAKVARVDEGVVAVTDGPYAEAEEYLGSFTIVDCESLDRALEIAAQNPASRYWGIEVRPLMHEANPDM